MLSAEIEAKKYWKIDKRGVGGAIIAVIPL